MLYYLMLLMTWVLTGFNCCMTLGYLLNILNPLSFSSVKWHRHLRWSEQQKLSSEGLTWEMARLKSET